MQVLDALTGIGILRKRGKALGEPATVVSGPGPILEHLKRQGYDVTLSADGSSLVVSAERYGPGIAELVDIAGGLLLASLQGEPLLCSVSNHRKPTEAVTIALGGTPYCGSCKAGAR